MINENLISNNFEFTVYSIQISISENVSENLEKIYGFIESARDNSLILLPEMFFCGFDYERLEEFISLSDKVIEELKKISKRKNLLICGTVPERENGKVLNTAYVISDGKIIGKRSKIKLFKPFNEHVYFSEGEENPVFETRFGRVGILICFELRFSEFISDFRRKDVDIVLVPAQWGLKRKKHLEILSVARAIELQSFVIVSDTWGKFKGNEFAGSSGIYSPWGEVLAFSDKGDTVLWAKINLKEREKVKRLIPMD